MNNRLIVVVLPNPKKRTPDLVLRTSAGSMVCAFASWETLLSIMENDLRNGATELPYRVSVTVADRIGHGI